MNPTKAFWLNHGYKIAAIIAMLAINIIVLVTVLQNHSNFFVTELISVILMFAPPVLLTVYVIRHRKDCFGDHVEWMDIVMPILKWFGVMALFLLYAAFLRMLTVWIPTFILS